MTLELLFQGATASEQPKWSKAAWATCSCFRVFDQHCELLCWKRLFAFWVIAADPAPITSAPWHESQFSLKETKERCLLSAKSECNWTSTEKMAGAPQRGEWPNSKLCQNFLITPDLSVTLKNLQKCSKKLIKPPKKSQTYKEVLHQLFFCL